LMRPFWTYYGGKFREAPKYPKPRFGTIIEPFAGAAGYATRYHDLNVILVEKDPTVAALWRWLIAASYDQIESLPLLSDGQSVDDLDVCQEAKHLIGFWLNKGASRPCKIPSAWMRGGTHATSFWGPEIRRRIADQVGLISHWALIEGDYSSAPDIEATWFIDPPYQGAGKHYRHGAKGIDFPALGAWCQARRGQVVVCENDGADWLPFKPYLQSKANESRSGGKVSCEAIWTNDL
jgi:hypothetical protein